MHSHAKHENATMLHISLAADLVQSMRQLARIEKHASGVPAKLRLDVLPRKHWPAQLGPRKGALSFYCSPAGFCPKEKTLLLQVHF